MNACILAIGSELLTPTRVDTNSLLITERLNAVGVEICFKAIVGDQADELRRVFALALSSVDLVVCTGGLGPTEDDITREAVAEILNAPLELNAEIEQRLVRRFARRGLTMASNNRRQAFVPRGATVLENDNGTAPGLWLTQRGVDVLLLPGPPREMTPMLDRFVQEHLADRTGGVRLVRRVVRISGRTESEVDAAVSPLYERWRTAATPISTTILTSPGQIELHLTARARSDADAVEALTNAVTELEAVLGDALFSSDGKSLEEIVGELLTGAVWTVAVAESCSGGLLTSRLTDVPGSSAYVERSVVCYSNQSKVDWLGVPEFLLAAHGAVSEPVAEAMARGVRGSAGSSVGIGVTGIAGPAGGTPEKPVGTVAIAVLVPTGMWVKTFRFVGGREHVKAQAAQAALNMLRLQILRRSSDLP